MTNNKMDQKSQDLPVENTSPPMRSIGFKAVMSIIFSSSLPSRCTATATAMKVRAKERIPM